MPVFGSGAGTLRRLALRLHHRAGLGLLPAPGSAALSDAFDRSLPSLADRHLDDQQDHPARFRAVGPRSALPRLHGRLATFVGLLVLGASWTRSSADSRSCSRSSRASWNCSRSSARSSRPSRPSSWPRPSARRDRGRPPLYLLVQQVENTFFVPKIQGDAIQLHPASSSSRSHRRSVGGPAGRDPCAAR